MIRYSLLFTACWPMMAMAADLPTDLPTKILKPHRYHFSAEKLSPPIEEESVSKNPKIKYLPEGEPVLNVPEGFAVNVYSKELNQPRWLVVSPEGDLLVAESYTHKIVRLIDSDKDGVSDRQELFATKDNELNQPFGMTYDEDYFYVGNTDGVRRYPYKKGMKKLEGKGEEITKLPGGGYNQHWTRNVVMSPDKEWLYISVGSKSNADEEEPPRASILRMRKDGSEREIFASGLRNPIGMAFHPQTGVLYAGVNERDKLGDDLVPDYITSVKEGGFYGWPYAYLSSDHIDPRHMEDGKSTHPEKVEETITPDVLLESHSAVMEVEFGAKTNFPAAYQNGLFATLRGSWNRNQGTGYKLIYVNFENNKAYGDYQDFLTGFLTKPEGPETWGRPVGLAVMPDGSLVFADEPNNRIFRVSYQGAGGTANE